MNTIIVQHYLTANSLSQLEIDHGVFASFDKTKTKISLNYGQLEAKSEDVLAQQCRGVILRKSDNSTFNKENIVGDTYVISRGMDRFFNFGQGAAADIDWSSARFQEKLDGTNCSVYFDSFTKEWNVCTRSCPEADIVIDDSVYTFRTLFEKALHDTCGLDFKDFTNLLNKEFTYVFELTTPINRIVVKYEEFKITLISKRKTLSSKEISIFDFDEIPMISKVKEFSFVSTKDMLDWVSTQNPMEYEGVVVVDKNFNRIKVKNANYIAFSKIRDQLSSSDRNMLRVILNEKSDDVFPFLSKFMQDKLVKMEDDYKSFNKFYSSKIIEFKFGTKKELALAIKGTDMWATPFFVHYDKGFNFHQFILDNKKDGDWSDSFLSKILDEMNKLKN